MAKQKKSSTGLESGVAGALCYVLGAFSGIFMLIVEREDKFVRFHAVQAILAHAAAYVIFIILALIPIVGWLLLPVWLLAAFIFWIVLIYEAYHGVEYELPYLGEIARRQVK
jgi:uncharacterized membrane protein